MSIKKNKNQLIISILVGLAIFIITYQFVIRQHEDYIKQRNQAEKMTQAAQNYAMNPEEANFYVVAKKELPENHVIAEDDIEMKYLEMKMSGACTNAKAAIGAKTAHKTPKGNPVILKDIVYKGDETNSEEPRIGYRAVAATIASNRIPPFVKDNITLDIYTANNTFQAANVRVLKISDGSGKSNKLIIFEIKEEDVSAFINGMTNDKLIPVQKNSNDETDYSFSYDPFKFSSYTVSNEDLKEFKTEEISTKENTNYTVPVNNKRNNSVEIIQGNSVKTLDF